MYEYIKNINRIIIDDCQSLRKTLKTVYDSVGSSGTLYPFTHNRGVDLMF